jgi:hypothetical protein
MRQTRLVRTFYNMHLIQFKTGRSKSASIKEVLRKLDSSPPSPADQRECHLLLKDVQTKIRKLHTEAVQKRCDFLIRRVDFECGGDQDKADRIRAMIQKAEDLRAVCKKIRTFVKPSHSSGLQTVLVPVDNPDPKRATVWKTIDDPHQVVSILQARNKKHFKQASGTPFTTGEFHSIMFDGSGPLADSVLDGSYQFADPGVQLLLDKLVRPANNAMHPIEDLLTAVNDRFKRWDETTSVSPFSKRYLTQYISLIMIIREPSKAQDVAQAILSTAKELLQLHVSLLQLAIQHKHSYTRWQRVANLMLEKDFGIPKSSGKPFLHDKINTTIPVQSPDQKATVHVPNRSVHSARRTLGPIKCPGRNQSAQYEALLKRVMSSLGRYNPAPCPREKLGRLISLSIFQKCVTS